MRLFSRLKPVGVGHAADHLERLGFSIVERNVRTRFGEVALIVRDDERIVFCEVTTSRLSSAPPPKTRPWPPGPEVRRTATTWLRETGSPLPAVERLRFDSIDVTINALRQLLSLDHRYVEHLAAEPTGGRR